MINYETNESYPLLRDCFEKLIRIKAEAGKERTAANYQSSWNKLSAFLGRKVNQVTIADFTPSMIQQYLLWLMQNERSKNTTLTPSSQDFYLRNLRAMYNKVVKELRFMPPAGNPFTTLHIKVPSTRKRALPKEEIKRLSELDLSATPHLASALHLALFLFYARGMCFIDAFNMRQENIKDDYLHYRRSKTGASLQVKITPEMVRIIRMYRQKYNPWLFPFLHEKMQGVGYVSAQSALHRINRYLNEIGEAQGYLHPLTTYVMRHSWASMMLEAGTEIGVISQSLGHMSLQTTEIYLGKLSVSKIDRAADNMLNNLIRNSEIKPEKVETKRRNQVVKKKISKAIIPMTSNKMSIARKCKNILALIAVKIFQTTW